MNIDHKPKGFHAWIHAPLDDGTFKKIHVKEIDGDPLCPSLYYVETTKADGYPEKLSWVIHDTDVIIESNSMHIVLFKGRNVICGKLIARITNTDIPLMHFLQSRHRSGKSKEAVLARVISRMPQDIERCIIELTKPHIQ